MLRVKNFMPAISIEGFEEATDSRRGNGTYQKIIHAMNILQERKLPFGIFCCYTSANAEVIGSEEYFDQMIGMGAKFAWFFTYMPVGKGAVKELMATAEQREMMYHRTREYRRTKPIFTVDFWNDGEYVGGCIAGGRCYCHINANGDIEPCAFIHYSDSNIREKTLLEAYQSPLFMGYHDNQPWNDNMLRPCPISCVWGFGGVLLHLLTVNNRWNHPAWIFVKCTAAGAALLRMHERQQQKPAENHIEYILDRCFTDQTLQQFFPKMKSTVTGEKIYINSN